MVPVFRSSRARVPAQGIPSWARVRGNRIPARVVRPSEPLLASGPVNALLAQSKETFPATVIEVPDLDTLYDLTVSKVGGGTTTWVAERGTGDMSVALDGGGLGTWPASGTEPNLSLTVALAGGGNSSWPLSVA